MLRCCPISCWRLLALTDGTTRYVWSANFTSELPGCNGFRSAAVTVYTAGPTPDPWMMLAKMLAVDDSSPLNKVLAETVICCRYSYIVYLSLSKSCCLFDFLLSHFCGEMKLCD